MPRTTDTVSNTPRVGTVTVEGQTLTSIAPVNPPGPSGNEAVGQPLYEQRPFVGPRKGRRNLHVPQESQSGSRNELGSIWRDRPDELDAVATTVRMLVKQDREVRYIRAAELERTPLREFDPVLRPSAYEDMPNRISKYVFRNPDGNHAVWAGSRNEENHLRELDWEGHCNVNTQFIQFAWNLPTGRVLNHYPDFLVGDGGSIEVVDIAAQMRMTPSRAAVYDLTARTCRYLGWTFSVGLDNISIARQRNLRFLAAFRHELRDVRVEEWGDIPLPRTMWGLVQAHGGGTRGWQHACAQLWHRHVGFDPDRLLDDTTALRAELAPSKRFAWEVAR